jgi:ATP-binding cassette subfamily F protein 3
VRAHRGQGLRIGYFAQHQLEASSSGEPPASGAGRSRAREQVLRDHLGSFAARAGAAGAGDHVWQRPNLLLLDEPPTILISPCAGRSRRCWNARPVSLDDAICRTTADALLLVEEGRVAPMRPSGRHWHAPAHPAPASGRCNRRGEPAEERVAAEAPAKSQQRNRCWESQDEAICRRSHDLARVESLLAAEDIYTPRTASNSRRPCWSNRGCAPISSGLKRSGSGSTRKSNVSRAIPS